MPKASKSPTTTPKYVYLFGDKKADGNGSMKPLLGGKGANLAEMTRIGLPVPPGFTITTEVCTWYYGQQADLSQIPQAGSGARAGLHGRNPGPQIRRHRETSARFRPFRRARFHARHDGHHFEPGPNDETVLALAKHSRNERFAWDCYRRFIQMYGDVVMGVQNAPTKITSPLKPSSTTSNMNAITRTSTTPH